MPEPEIRGFACDGLQRGGRRVCQAEGHRGEQRADLRDGQREPVRHRLAVGAVPPHRPPRPGGAPGQVGALRRLVLLGLPAGGACGQDDGHHRFRPHRAPDRPDREGAGHARHRQRLARESRLQGGRVRLCGPGHALQGERRGGAALPGLSRHGGHDQQGLDRQDEGRSAAGQQQPRAAGGGAGPCGGPGQRQAGRRRGRCRLHRADQGRQPVAEGEELHHHPAHELGRQGGKAEDHGHHRGECEGVSGR